jgi:agmatinase
MSDPEDTIEGDRAFLATDDHGMGFEAAYAGASSFLRRRYSRDLSGVDLVIAGVPLDVATSHRPGARLGPAAVRAASAHLAWGPAWPWGYDPFERLAAVDYGDLAWDYGRPETIPERIEAGAAHIVASGTRLLALGGDHFITLPLLRALCRARGGPVAVVHFDAHPDTWVSDEDAEGPARMDHGSMMFYAVREGLVDTARSVQVGIRTHATQDLGFTVIDAAMMAASGPAGVAKRIRDVVQDAPAYLTFDIDCIDPAYAPGTGTPVVGGPTTADVRTILRGLAGLRFVGFDVVEVSPPFDHAQLTALAAATVGLDLVYLAVETPDA